MASANSTTVVFLGCLLKIFEIIESRKPRGNVDDLFGLKRYLSGINIPDKVL